MCLCENGRCATNPLSITHRHSVYAFGCNDEGQLGLADADDNNDVIEAYTPTLLPFFAHRTVLSISCGDRHALALTRCDLP